MKAVKSFRVLILVLSTSMVFNVFGQENGKTEVKIDKTSDTTQRIEKINSPVSQVLTDTNKEERYRIGYQDTIEVNVHRQSQLSGRYNINPNGLIYLPKLDEPIMAVCKTEFELGKEIANQYSKSYLRNPFVTVTVVEQRSRSFSVLGAVEKPGHYYINRKIHLLELLAYAGGPSKEAGTRLLVARAGSDSECKLPGESESKDDEDVKLIALSLSDVVEAKESLWMKPGDVVSILKSEVVYVVGNVVEPKPVDLKEQMTLTQAIAAAHGLKPATKTDNVKVLRQKTGSTEREELVFNLRKIEKREINDPILQPNDIVSVSEDRVKSIFNSVVKALTGGASNVPYIIR